MATDGCDSVLMPASGKLLQVVAFRSLWDSNIDASLRSGDPFNPNPLRVCLFLTYGAPHDAYTGSHTELPENGVDGWVLDSDNPIESVQEYKRWWHAATGRMIIEFCFNSPFDVSEKADLRTVKIAGHECTQTIMPYESIGIDLLFKSTHNERIEVWQERQEPYKKADGSAIAIARMAVIFKWGTIPSGVA